MSLTLKGQRDGCTPDFLTASRFNLENTFWSFQWLRRRPPGLGPGPPGGGRPQAPAKILHDGAGSLWFGFSGSRAILLCRHRPRCPHVGLSSLGQTFLFQMIHEAVKGSLKPCTAYVPAMDSRLALVPPRPVSTHTVLTAGQDACASSTPPAHIPQRHLLSPWGPGGSSTHVSTREWEAGRAGQRSLCPQHTQFGPHVSGD